MNRRGFISTLAGTIAVAATDPEKLLVADERTLAPLQPIYPRFYDVTVEFDMAELEARVIAFYTKKRCLTILGEDGLGDID